MGIAQNCCSDARNECLVAFDRETRGGVDWSLALHTRVLRIRIDGSKEAEQEGFVQLVRNKKARRLSENPYETPSLARQVAGKRSYLPYALVTMAVVAVLSSVVAIIGWYGSVSIENGVVSLLYDDVTDSVSPYGDITISTYSITSDVAVVGGMIGIVYLASIAIANGVVFFCRR